MARLSSYYTLCPLIDQQNLLGVERDSNPGCAIVTLGKNIVIRYKLHDLKQVSSWSTKERLTTQVVYDETSNNYVAVFNGKNIRIWEEQETNLDDVKKYKFLSSIHTILTVKKLPLILVKQNGATAVLNWALNNREVWNDPGILLPNEKILNCQLVNVKNKIYLCTLVKSEHVYSYIVVPLKEEDYREELDHISRIELKCSSEKLVGHVIVQDNDNNANLLTLWSHGHLYNYTLIDPTVESVPGKLVSVITTINTKHAVVMVALNESTVAMYGADADEEGAVLIIYNIQFKLVQAVQKLKLFTSDAKLWKIEDKLLLAANRHLAIVPYSLAPQRFEAMLGSTLHFKNDASAEDTIRDWGLITSDETSHRISMKDHKKSIATQVLTYLRQGMSHTEIHLNLIPHLIEAKDVSSILWCLDNLKSLPEELLIQLLGFWLRESHNSDITKQNNVKENSSTDMYESARNQFLLSKIIGICYTDNFVVPYLRTGLSFDEILKLLNYLIDKLNDENSSDNLALDHEYGTNRVSKWINFLIDSHYQHYLLSQDVQVYKLFNKLKEALDIQLALIKELENLRPMIKRLIDVEENLARKYELIQGHIKGRGIAKLSVSAKKCICQRPYSVIIYLNCEHLMFGRIRYRCSKHPMTTFLIDITNCPKCKCHEYMLSEFDVKNEDDEDEDL